MYHYVHIYSPLSVHCTLFPDCSNLHAPNFTVFLPMQDEEVVNSPVCYAKRVWVALLQPIPVRRITSSDTNYTGKRSAVMGQNPKY